MEPWCLLILFWLGSVNATSVVSNGEIPDVSIFTGDYKNIMSMWDLMHGITTDPNDHCTILRTLGQLRKVDEAVRYYKKIGLANIAETPEAVEILVELLAEAHESRFLWLVFDGLRKVKLPKSRKVYIILAKHFTEAKELVRLWSVYCEMKTVGTKANFSTYLKMIRSFADNGMWGEAWQVFLDMRKWKLPYDLETCKVLLKALVAADQKEKLHQLTAMIAGRITPTASYNIAILQYALAGQIEDAYEIFLLMGHGNLKKNRHTHSITPTATDYVGVHEEAFSVSLKEKRGERIEYTFKLMIHHLLKNNCEEHLADVFNVMMLDGFQRDSTVLSNLLKAYKQLSMADAAWKVFDDFKQARFIGHQHTYSLLIQTFVSTHRPMQAWEVYKNMLQIGVAVDIPTFKILTEIDVFIVDGVRQESICLIQMLKHFHDMNMADAAWRVFGDISHTELKGRRETYVLMIKIFALKQWTDRTWEVYEYMRQIGQAADVATCWILVETLFKGTKGDEIYKVLEVFALMQEQGMIGPLPNGEYINQFSRVGITETIHQVMAQAQADLKPHEDAKLTPEVDIVNQLIHGNNPCRDSIK